MTITSSESTVMYSYDFFCLTVCLLTQKSEITASDRDIKRSLD